MKSENISRLNALMSSDHNLEKETKIVIESDTEQSENKTETDDESDDYPIHYSPKTKIKISVPGGENKGRKISREEGVNFWEQIAGRPNKVFKEK